MARVKYPCERFGHDVGRIDFAGDVCHIDDTGCFPVLGSEEWDSNVTGAFCWDAGGGDFDSGVVISTDEGCAGLRETKVGEN